MFCYCSGGCFSVARHQDSHPSASGGLSCRVGSFQGGPVQATQSSAAASVVVVYPPERKSPFRGVPWDEVFALMAVRFAWEKDVALSLHAFSSSQAIDASQNILKPEFRTACEESGIFLAVDVNDELSTSVVKAAQSFQWPAFLILDSPGVRSSVSATQCNSRCCGYAGRYRWALARAHRAGAPDRCQHVFTAVAQTQCWPCRQSEDRHLYLVYPWIVCRRGPSTCWPSCHPQCHGPRLQQPGQPSSTSGGDAAQTTWLSCSCSPSTTSSRPCQPRRSTWVTCRAWAAC